MDHAYGFFKADNRERLDPKVVPLLGDVSSFIRRFLYLNVLKKRAVATVSVEKSEVLKLRTVPLAMD